MSGHAHYLEYEELEVLVEVFPVAGRHFNVY